MFQVPDLDPELKKRLARSKFRSRFHLTERDKAFIAECGWEKLHEQARKLITKRLAPAFPENDGSQTPMRGHVIFTAQHATGTCCRGCLQKWHGIMPGKMLTDDEIEYVCMTLLSWLKDRAGNLSGFPHTPDLFG